MPNIELQRFMVFNSGEGQGEGREGDKLIFHWSRHFQDLSQTEQINDICLCDACINVSDRLNENFVDHQEGSSLSASIHRNRKSLILTFENAVIVVLQVEPLQSIWMAAKVAIEQPDDDASQTSRSKSHSNQSSAIPAESIKRIVNNIYARFRMLKGSFRMLIDTSNVVVVDDDGGGGNKSLIREKLRSTCKEYFGPVLKSMHLNSILSNDTALYNNITYIDLDPLTSLKVISFINHLVCMSANKIRHTLVIFNDQLLWSSLTLYDTRLLYNYMISVLIKNAVQEELSKEVDKVRRIKENFIIYLTESSISVSEQHNSSSPSSSFCADGSSGETDMREEEICVEPTLTQYYMTVFRSSNLTLCLILDEPSLAEPIENTLTSALASLARHVGQDYIESMRKLKGSSSISSASKTTKRP